MDARLQLRGTDICGSLPRSHSTGLAQWQSTRFVSGRSVVQTRHSALASSFARMRTRHGCPLSFADGTLLRPGTHARHIRTGAWSHEEGIGARIQGRLKQEIRKEERNEGTKERRNEGRNNTFKKRKSRWQFHASY